MPCGTKDFSLFERKPRQGAALAQTANNSDITAKKGVSLSQAGPEVSGALRTILDDAVRSGIADHLQVNGTVRTTEENKKVGGSPTSDHVTNDVTKKAAGDVRFTKDGKNVDRQVYEHLASNPSILNNIGHGFQLIFHGHEGGKGLPEHIHLGWKGSRSDNEFTTEHSVRGEPNGYHVRSTYDSSGRVTASVYPW
jgi:2-oxoglutarate dehydrogenase complex dehydrogenase (E1) component-like enzyme